MGILLCVHRKSDGGCDLRYHKQFGSQSWWKWNIFGVWWHFEDFNGIIILAVCKNPLRHTLYIFMWASMRVWRASILSFISKFFGILIIIQRNKLRAYMGNYPSLMKQMYCMQLVTGGYKLLLHLKKSSADQLENHRSRCFQRLKKNGCSKNELSCKKTG